MTPHCDVAEVPVAWLCAQDGASQLLAQSGVSWPPASFEYRAAHDVLALTLLFARRSGAGLELSPGKIGLLRALVADDVEWAVWCQARLNLCPPGLPRADRHLAVRAFRWLAASRLLGGSLSDVVGACTATANCRGAGVSVGVALARQQLARPVD